MINGVQKSLPGAMLGGRIPVLGLEIRVLTSANHLSEGFGEINTNDGRDVNCCFIVLTHRNVICALGLVWRSIFLISRHSAALKDDFSVCPLK